MASTLVRRLTVPDYAAGDARLSIHAGHGVFGEILAGRLERTVLSTWLSEAELVDANIILDHVLAGTYTLGEAFCWAVLGEREIYTRQRVEELLQLPPSEEPPPA